MGLFDLNSQSSAWVLGQWGPTGLDCTDTDHGQLSIDWSFTVAVDLHSSQTNTLTDLHVIFNKTVQQKMYTLCTQTGMVNYHIYILILLDKHNNYFTLMMHIIHIPVKLCFRVDFDISLMIVIETSGRKI